MDTLSLTAIALQQLDAARQDPAGRSVHTVYGGHGRVLRQTIIALTAGRLLAEHANPGDATVQVLHGRVRLAADVCWVGSAGDLLIVPPVRHSGGVGGFGRAAQSRDLPLMAVASAPGRHSWHHNAR